MGSLNDSPLNSLPDGLRDAYSVVAEAWADGLRPDREYTASEWADEYRMVPAMSSAEPGPWRTSRTPYLREIMDVLSPGHPATEVTFCKGTQVGGSEAVYNFIGAIIDLWPAPTMLVMPTTDTGKRISRQRLAPMIEQSPRLREKVADAKSRDSANTVLLKEFPGGMLCITGANSGPGLRSMPVRNLIMDEVDAYPADVDGEGDPCVIAQKRTDTFARKKIVRVSSPKLKATSRIWRYWELSDQRRYHVACPHCAHEQWLRWEQMRWDTRRVLEITRADDGEVVQVDADTPGAVERDTREVHDVHYECEACQQRIDEHHKTRMLEGGRWIAARPGGGRHPGYHLSALYSPLGWFSWHQCVQQFLDAEYDVTGELRQAFSNTVLGEPWQEGGEQADTNELAKHIGDYRLGGKIPRDALMLTCGVDVQHDRLEARVWGWGRGEQSWLVAREVIDGSPTDDVTWARLDDLLFRAWPHEGGSTLRIVATAIDAGDGQTTHYVRAYCRKWTSRHVIAIKGQSVAGKPILGRPTDQDVTHRGRTAKGGIKLWPVGADTAKAVLYARYQIDEPGAGYVHLPQGLPDDELKQMTSERVVTRWVRGYPRREWVKDSGARNEALDCAVYALAAAHYAGVSRANWDRIEQLLVQPDMFVAPAAPVPAVAPVATATPAAEPGAPESAAAEATLPTEPSAEGSVPPAVAAPLPVVRPAAPRRPATPARVVRRPSMAW